MPEPVALLWALSTHAHLTVGNQSRGSLGGPRWGGAVVPQAEPLLPAPASGRPGMEWMCGLSQGMERGPGIALQAMQEKKALSSRGRGRKTCGLMRGWGEET